MGQLALGVLAIFGGAGIAEAGKRQRWKSSGRSTSGGYNFSGVGRNGIPLTYGRHGRVIPMPTYASTSRMGKSR